MELPRGSSKLREKFHDVLSQKVIGQNNAKDALVDAVFTNIFSIVPKN